MEETENLTYKVKCRSCLKISEMWFAKKDQVKLSDFKTFCIEHSTFPIQKQCDCDNSSMLFHDLVSYTLIF